MKKILLIMVLVSVAGLAARAEDAKPAAKPVPDKLTTCPVSGDKLGGDMGKPFVFIYKGQEVKLCCPDCKKEFDKNPDKFIAKIRAADKK
jgi:YHS domain-containing protein